MDINMQHMLLGHGHGHAAWTWECSRTSKYLLLVPVHVYAAWTSEYMQLVPVHFLAASPRPSMVVNMQQGHEDAAWT